MKKLLVILMLGAGLVTVASAAQNHCNIDPSNQCCIDVSQMSNEMANLPNHAIRSSDGYYVTMFSQILEAGGVTCEDEALYSIIPGQTTQTGNFQWTAGQYSDRLIRVSNSSSAK